MRYLILFLLLWSSTAFAQYDLVSLDRLDQVRDWRAVGLLEIDGSGTCTGTLIEADLVLTAAHCLVDPEGRPYEPENITFRAAFQYGTQAASVTGAAIAVLPAYDNTTRDLATGFALDVGLLKLTFPVLSTQVRSMRVVDLLRRDDEVAVVSYGRGRNDAPSLQRLCNILQRDDSLVMMDCASTFGSSGAPVFVIRDGAPRVAAVLVGGTNMSEAQYSLAVSLEEHLPRLQRQLLGVNGEVGGQAGNSITTIRVGERSNTGALFVQVGD